MGADRAGTVRDGEGWTAVRRASIDPGRTTPLPGAVHVHLRYVVPARKRPLALGRRPRSLLEVDEAAAPGRRCDAREPQCEHRAFVHDALDHDVAAHGAGQLAADRQPEP